MNNKNSNKLFKIAIIALSLGFTPALAWAQMQEGVIKLLPPHLTVEFKLNTNLPDDATEYYSKITDAIVSAIPRKVDLLHDTADFAKIEPVYERIGVVVKLPVNKGGSVIRNFNIDIAIPQEKADEKALEIKYVNRSDVVRKGDIVVHTGRYEDFIRKIEAIRNGKLKQIEAKIPDEQPKNDFLGGAGGQTKSGDWFSNELARIVREGKVDSKNADRNNSFIQKMAGSVNLPNSSSGKNRTVGLVAVSKDNSKLGHGKIARGSKANKSENAKANKEILQLPVGKFMKKVKINFFGDSDEIIAPSAAALEQFLSGMLSVEGKKAQRLRFVLVTNLGLEKDYSLAEKRFDNVESFAVSRGVNFSQYDISFISINGLDEQYLVIEVVH